MEDHSLYNDHIQNVKIQRDYYRTQVEESKIQYTALPEDRKQRGIFITGIIAFEPRETIISHDNVTFSHNSKQVHVHGSNGMILVFKMVGHRSLFTSRIVL